MGARKLAGTFVALVALAGLAWGQPGPETPEIRDYSTFVDVLSRTPADEPSDQAFVGLATAPRVLGATGTAAVSIPIYMPPGRGEANPLFDPSYSSHREDGLLGAGWDLLVGCIKRSTKEGVPFLYQKNPSDPFRYPVPGDGVGVPGEYVLQIGGEQVSLDHYLGTGPGGHLFGSTAEERFWRVAFDPASNTWVVTQKTGVRFVFGAGGPETRSGFDVSQAGGTFSWGLVRIEDPNGNVVDYSYGTHGLEFPLNRALYPTRVQWGANPGAGYAHVYEIEVLYEDRPDRPPSYLFGFEFYRSVRPSEIVVRALGETVRRYEFEYEQAPYVGTTRLVRVRAFGAPTPEEPGGLAYPPSTFVYADGPTGFGEDVSLPVQGGWSGYVQLYELRTTSFTRTSSTWTRDGLPDIVASTSGDPEVPNGLPRFAGGQAQPWYVLRLRHRDRPLGPFPRSR
ncbi:MAG: hypothetical protein KatS3mg076_0101 [Candidatus Binatia bacterium]|nr:MAG: hypothetical protein KatS3mg076_0101 [Candidatus Binatia bacterium]